MLLGAPFIMLLAPTLYAEKGGNEHHIEAMTYTNSAFELGLTALYFQAYSTSLPTISNARDTSNDSGSFSARNRSFNAPWDWAGIIEGRYHLSDKNDVNLNWMYYSFDTQGTNKSNSFNQFFDTFQQSEIIDQSSTSNNTTGTITLNSVNAEFAHSFELSRSTVRLFAGAQYLNVADKFNESDASFSTETSSSGVIPNIDQSTSITKDKYEGVGPRIGLGANYKLKEHFSVFANSAAAIVLARQTRSLPSSNLSSGLGATNSSTSLSSLHRDIAIPELEVQLGLAFSKPIDRGLISLSSGWSVINYFNFFQSSDLTLSGPFLQGRWIG